MAENGTNFIKIMVIYIVVFAFVILIATGVVWLLEEDYTLEKSFNAGVGWAVTISVFVILVAGVLVFLIEAWNFFTKKKVNNNRKNKEV